MNCRKILILIFFSVNFLSSIVFASGAQCELPSELFQTIVTYFKIESSARVPLKKDNAVISNEKLHFPTTGFIEFINYTASSSNSGPEELRRLERGSRVLPHVQLWNNGSWVRIDNDLKSIKTRYDAQLNGILFDVRQDMVVTAERSNRLCEINLRELSKNCSVRFRHPLNSNIEFADRDSSYCDRLSLCFHDGSSPFLLSVICAEGSEEVSEQSKLMLFAYQSYKLVPTTINIPQEISLIQKHEYIGANTFLLLAANKLFFAVYDNNTPNMIFFKQKFKTQKGKEWEELDKTQKVKEWQELEVLSFSANQDQDKKTLAGRARYFALVVREPLDDKPGKFQKKVLLCDLLNPTNTLLKIWQADFNEENVDFDRISFGNDTLSLWNDHWNKQDAMKISLDKNWDNNFEWPLLINWIKTKGKFTPFIKSLTTDPQKVEEKRYFRLPVILSSCFFLAICCLIFKFRQYHLLK